MKKLLGAVAAACAMLGAGQAHAALMHANLYGSFNGDPYISRFHTQIFYNTALGETNAVPGGVQLSWNNASGTLSPISMIQVTLYPHYVQSTNCGGECFISDDIARYRFYDFESLAITHAERQFTFVVQGTDLNARLGYSGFISQPPLDPPGTNFNLDQPYSGGNIYFDYGSWTVPSTNRYPYTSVINIDPVPEPATWAMMLLGFFGSGAALRSRRYARRLAPLI